MEQSISVSAPGLAVSDVLQAISQRTGVDVAAVGPAADEKVVIFGPRRPAAAILADLAALFNYQWERQMGEKGPAYRLVRPASAERYEARLLNTVVERMLVRLNAQARALGEAPEQLAARPADDPIRQALSDPRRRLATEFYAALGEGQRRSILTEGRLRIPFEQLPARDRTVLINALDHGLTEIGATGDRDQLRRFLEEVGPQVLLLNQDGEMVATVKLCGIYDLWLATFDPATRWIVPERGDPYRLDEKNQSTKSSVFRKGPGPSFLAQPTMVDALRKLSETAGVPVMADYYRTPPVAKLPAPPGTTSSPATSDQGAEGLDLLCRRYGYLWWQSGGSLLFRQRNWYEQRLAEVPDRWMVALSEALVGERPQPTVADVLLVLNLRPAQLRGLLSMARPAVRHYSLPVDEATSIHDLLSLYGASSVSRSTRILRGPSIPAEQERTAITYRTMNLRQAQRLTEVLASIPDLKPADPTSFRMYMDTGPIRTAADGSRFVPVAMRWSMGEQVGLLAVPLPLSLPDDRRKELRVE